MPVLATVPSQTTATVTYEISRTLQGNLTCSCPAFRYCWRFPRTCKHLQTYRPPEPERLELEVARRLAEQVLSILEPKVARASIAGSIRRMQPLVKDIDIVIQPECSPEDLAQALEDAGGQEVHAVPATVTLLWQGAKVEVYLAEPGQYSMLLLWRTGSASHNVQMASRAKRLGLELRKSGVMKDGERLAWQSESEIFAALGLAYRRPEDRS